MSKFNIPLSEPYSPRVSAVNASDSTSGYVGVGIVGLMIVGKTTQSTDKDARHVNCFKQTVGRRVSVVKRPGFETFNTPASGQKGYSILVWSGQGNGQKVITAFGETNSTIYDSTTSLGAITGRSTGITETVVGAAVPTLAISSSDSTGWYYDTVTGVVTKITDVDFPGNAGKTLAGTFSHLKGFACVLTTDSLLYAGDVNTMTGWTSNSYDSANSYPDKGVATMRHGEFIMVFKARSLEFWYNAGLSPFPLARALAKTVQVGCIGSDAVTEISDTKFWVGSTPQGGISVFQYDGSVSRVSTPAIDAVLILAGASNISMTTIRNLGFSFVYVRAGATTFAYCIEEKFWFLVSSTTNLCYKAAGLSLGGTMVNYAISNISTSGKVYLQNHASLTFEDDGVTYTARIQTNSQDEGTDNMKTYGDLSITADTESSASELTVSCSDDDFLTWQTMGTVDLSEDRPLKITRLGAARARAFALIHSANTPMRIHRAQGNLKTGTA